MLQFLNPEGELAAETPLAGRKEFCLDLFRWMHFVRAFDAAALSLQRQGRISFCNPSTGQEATQIGSAAALSREDWVFPSYRVAGIYLYRNGSPLPLFNQLYGNAADLSRGRQMPMHFADRSVRFFSVSSPVGTQITQAAGLAYAAKIRRDPVVAIAYFGDGATSTNDFHAGLNLAGVLRAPAIFFCDNNQYALSVPLRRQTASQSIAAKAAAYGITGVQVDGNDVLAVYTATRDAAQQCRGGCGPVLIEAVTYRAGPHSSTDNPSFYRSPEEEAAWKDKDPLLRCRRFLQKQRWWSDAWEEAIRSEQAACLQDAIAKAERTPAPAAESLFEDVWAERPPRLERQCQRMRESLGVEENHDKDYRFPI
jgi:2-oxoisovalerate dehydrogenase E1 component alpha subunit